MQGSSFALARIVALQDGPSNATRKLTTGSGILRAGTIDLGSSCSSAIGDLIPESQAH